MHQNNRNFQRSIQLDLISVFFVFNSIPGGYSVGNVRLTLSTCYSVVHTFSRTLTTTRATSCHFGGTPHQAHNSYPGRLGTPSIGSATRPVSNGSNSLAREQWCRALGQTDTMAAPSSLPLLPGTTFDNKVQMLLATLSSAFPSAVESLKPPHHHHQLPMFAFAGLVLRARFLYLRDQPLFFCFRHMFSFFIIFTLVFLRAVYSLVRRGSPGGSAYSMPTVYPWWMLRLHNPSRLEPVPPVN